MVDPRAEQLRRIFDVFPSGVSDAQRGVYLEIVQNNGISLETLTEAVDRIIATREVSTAPKPAMLLRVCREVRAEQMTAERESPIPQRPALPTADDRRHIALLRELYINRGVQWCDKRNDWILPPNRHRCRVWECEGADLAGCEAMIAWCDENGYGPLKRERVGMLWHQGSLRETLKRVIPR